MKNEFVEEMRIKDNIYVEEMQNMKRKFLDEFLAEKEKFSQLLHTSESHRIQAEGEVLKCVEEMKALSQKCITLEAQQRESEVKHHDEVPITVIVNIMLERCPDSKAEDVRMTLP